MAQAKWGNRLNLTAFPAFAADWLLCFWLGNGPGVVIPLRLFGRVEIRPNRKRNLDKESTLF